MMKIFSKIRKKCIKLRLQPIHVFCFHHVCQHIDADSMHKGDWMALDEFKKNVLAMQQKGANFISISDAYNRLNHSLSPLAFRLKKYVVLTFDDGYASLKEVLPWLKELGIPATLFINPDYAAGKAYRESDKEEYLTLEELAELDVEIGMHGLQHIDVTNMDEYEFCRFVESSANHVVNPSLKHFIPFWAYTWGRYNSITDKVLKENGITPVYMDGMKNYNDASCIHRELLDNYKLC